MSKRDTTSENALRAAAERLAACLGESREPTIPVPIADLEAAIAAAAEAERRLVEQAARIAALERLALDDELTGLLNRRGFTHEFEHVLSSARRYDETGVLVYIDLDGFKPINDTYGHAAGDEVLRQVGRLLADCIRDTDHAARLGGDEFAVLLTRTAWDDGIKRAEALDDMLNTACIAWDGRLIALKASLGVQIFDAESDGAALIRHADGAMYQSKRLRHSRANRAAA